MSENQPQQDPIIIPLFDELRGQRIVIHPLRESDVPHYYEAITEAQHYRSTWLPFADKFHSESDILAHIRRGMADHILRKSMKSHIWDIQTNQFLGSCSIRPHDWTIRHFEIGYWLRPGATGKGYMSEAVQLVVDYLLESLQAQRIVIRCDEDNHASAAVARRLGFVYEGTNRHALSGPNGKLVNAMVFSLIPEDRQ